jgi:flagellar export protein FliJ
MDQKRIRVLLNYKKLLEERARAEMLKVLTIYENESDALKDQQGLKKKAYDGLMEEIKRGVLAKEGLLFVDYLKWLDSLIESQRGLLERIQDALSMKRAELRYHAKETKKVAKVDEKIQERQRYLEEKRQGSFQDAFGLMMKARLQNLQTGLS